MNSVANVSRMYGPKFADSTTAKEDFEYIQKKMALSDYLRYTEDHAAPHALIRTYVSDELLDSGFPKDIFEYLSTETPHVFVRGTYVLTERGDGSGEQDALEDPAHFVPLLVLLKGRLLDRIGRKVYVTHVLAEKSSKLVHPTTVQRCMDGNTRFEGGFVMPGFDKPVATTILDPAGKTMVTVVSGGVFGNFNALGGDELTPRLLLVLGRCQRAAPARLANVTLRSGEQLIHLFKAFAAVEYPAAFGAEGKTEENFETLEMLKDEPRCKGQKKLGQQVRLNGERFFAVQPLVNPKIMALALVLRMANKDGVLTALVLANVFHGHRVVEGAMHGGDGGFSGPHHDFAWTSVGGAPGVFLEPDTVQDDTPRKRFFELGIALVQGAWDGDQPALTALGLDAALDATNMMDSAARIFMTVCDDLAAAAAQ